MNDNFDKELSGFLKLRAAISPEKNITEAAIEDAARKQERKGAVKNMRFSVRIAVTAICSVVIAFTGMMAFSEDVRIAASNIVQTIFSLDKEGDSYKIVEKDSTEEMTILNFGGIHIEEFARDQLINKLGFEPFVPEKLGEFKKVEAEIGMSLNGKSSDLLQLSNSDLMEMLRNYPNDERLQGFNSKTRFSMVFSKSGQFSGDYVLFIHMAKPLEKPFRDDSTFEEKISQFSYKGVECRYTAQVKADHPMVFDGQFAYTDNTKQPKGIVKQKIIEFDMDGFHFLAGYVAKGGTDLDAFDYEVTKKFVEDFIDEYKSKHNN
ncbi:hypothetical protein [Pseudobacteroides cellulosolvens]|uniref:DUF4367 domain-containing protein n=1 Tax=Pseudobacteroides cellulosolvens ATCC 35603 = DSM 2933 TaxID=398512 RepID=A0A0L6JVY9_9FIRM|nr:hypothetical protein [Pseudobacteroides cellulosolvens]KNY29889.1 hypothetical protein Bccel_5166 [Pseudobacteroides cellulosolvens ATCC 35603 = DSM 2933]KNY30196.1 hypothetical protein Bccel_5473 [Pseudobacteroides cellulosolvens ATCC 35603 = DSM 2933]